jgi:hypothetical protein
MSDPQARGLTRREFDAVIRRAAELASSDVESSERELSEGELFRIAGEVGLSEGHVRTALAEVRSGVERGGMLDRVFGPSHVRASRVVPGTPETLGQTIDEYFGSTQLLQRVRRTPTFLQYRPAADWTSQMARAGFGGKTSLVAAATSVEVQLEPIEGDRTFLAFLVEPGSRAQEVGGTAFGGTLAGVVGGAGAGVGLAFVTPIGLAVGAGVLVAGGLWSAIVLGTGSARRRKLGDVQTELEGLLDALASGTPLEPPPPAWRKWVKRHLGGVARDILGAEEIRQRGRRQP